MPVLLSFSTYEVRKMFSFKSFAVWHEVLEVDSQGSMFDFYECSHKDKFIIS